MAIWKPLILFFIVLMLGCGPRFPRLEFTEQTWTGDGYVLAPEYGWQIDRRNPTRGKVLQEYSKEGVSGRCLETPVPLNVLSNLPGLICDVAPLQLGRDTYVLGIPAHPAWNCLPSGSFGRLKNGASFRDFSNKAEAKLYRSKDFGPWEEVVRLVPKTSNGQVLQIIPLGDGSFIGIARELFSVGTNYSPLARFHKGQDGKLFMGELLSLDGSGEAPAVGNGEIYHLGRGKLNWRPGCRKLAYSLRVIWTPQGLVLQSWSGLMLLNHHDGSLMHLTLMPEWMSIYSCQPMQDGRLLALVRDPKDRPELAMPWESKGRTRSPMDNVVRGRMTFMSAFSALPKDFQWMSLDPANGKMERVESSLRFRWPRYESYYVDPYGKPHALK